MVKRLKRDWWIPVLNPMIDHMLASCEICAQHNIRRSLIAPIGHIPQSDGPFRHLIIDFVDMAERRERKRYILVVVDRFSRWVETHPAVHADADTVVKFLRREVIPRFGITDKLSSDNGAHFLNKVAQKVSQVLQMNYRFRCVYHLQSQGMVERANGTLKAKLAKICADTKLTCVQALPLALMSMRMQTNCITHLTPH